MFKIIQDKLALMTDSQQKIGIFILDNPHLVASLSAAEFAKEVGVSDATIVRFAQEIGFSGFTEMKNSIKQSMRGHSPYVNFLPYATNELQQQHNQIAKLGKADTQSLENLFANYDATLIETAIQSICNADKIYFMALGSAMILQDLLSIHLNHMGFNVIEASQHNSPNFEKLANITSNDLLIAISFPRYSLNTCKAVEFANEQGAAILGITDKITSPIASGATIALTVPTNSTESFFNSYVLPMGICNILLMKLFFHDSDKMSKNIKAHIAKLDHLSSL